MNDGRFNVKCIHSDLVSFGRGHVYEASELTSESFLIVDNKGKDYYAELDWDGYIVLDGINVQFEEVC